MPRVECRTQAELDAALAAGDYPVLVGDGSFFVVGNSTVRASGNSTVEASGNVIVRALGRAVIAASIAVVVVCHGSDVQVTGGIKIVAKEPSTPAEWCEHHGVEVKDGVAILYKGVYDTWRSDHGFDYTPGTTPIAPDWDEGKKECGGGLHFSPCPLMTRQFCSAATKFVACPVALADMRAPKSGDVYPQKIKARGCSAPVYECDIDGERVAVVESAGVA